MVSLEENKALVHDLFERVVNKQELEVADRTVSPEYIDHAAERLGTVSRGPASIRDFVSRQRSRYADAYVVIEDMVAEGDKVVVRICMTGTSARRGVAVRFRGSVWWRIAGGKIVERWATSFAREDVSGDSVEGET